MLPHPTSAEDNQADPTAVERHLLDNLLQESRLYRSSRDYQELLEFVERLRNFAPLNAMLLQIQKPGLSYAASKKDWFERFGLEVKEGARPLLIMWPFGPVALVYDVMDTEGATLRQDVVCFPAQGDVEPADIARYVQRSGQEQIDCLAVDAGDANADMIKLHRAPANAKDPGVYRLHYNRNHTPPIQLVTLAHELAHLFLGHLGKNENRGIPDRRHLSHNQVELEAETVAYIVSIRRGVTSKSQTYLAKYVQDEAVVESLALYQIMKTAGKVEGVLGLDREQRGLFGCDGGSRKEPPAPDLFDGRM